MRRISVFVVAALLCCSLPAYVSAEGFLPGMPSFGGWSCAPAHKADCSVDGKLGYLGYPRGFVFDIVATGTHLLLGNRALTPLQQQFPVEGIWVGASATGAGPERGFVACDPGNPLCLRLAVSWLFPNNKEATEQDLYLAGDPNLVFLYRAWRPNIQWYTLDASAARCAWVNFSLVGGFRYDSFSTKFSDPSLDNLGLGLPSDEGELVLSSYIPYVGAETTWGPVKVGVLGFPWVPGTIQYRETFGLGTIGFGAQRLEATGAYRNCYFLETFAEFGKQLGVVHLSGFATYTLLHAVGEFPTSLSAFDAITPASSWTCGWGFDRQNWIVGGKVVIGLNSPL